MDQGLSQMFPFHLTTCLGVQGLSGSVTPAQVSPPDLSSSMTMEPVPALSPGPEPETPEEYSADTLCLCPDQRCSAGVTSVS